MYHIIGLLSLVNETSDYLNNIGSFLSGVAAITGVIWAIVKFIVRPFRKICSFIWHKLNAIDELLTSSQDKDIKIDNMIATLTHMETQLVRNELHQNALLRDNIYGIFECDLNGNNIYANRTYSKTLGVANTDLLEQGWMRYIHPEDLPKYSAIWKDEFSACREFECDVRFMTATNSELIGHIRCYPIVRFMDNTCSTFFGTIRFSNYPT